jgi:hypothetical protein
MGAIMDSFCSGTMNSLLHAQNAVNSEFANYWNAVEQAADLIQDHDLGEQNAIAQAVDEFSLAGDELLPMSEAIDNVLRQRIEQEHQVSDNYEP